MGANKVLWVDPELCVGCQMCELMCSLQKTGSFNPYLARIKVTKRPEKGLNLPIICRHCQKAKCQMACPEGALERDIRTGAVMLNEAKCIGCRACAAACPFGAIQIGPQGEILKCDLCGGEPTCVQFCSKRPENTSPLRPNPEGATALKYVPPHLVTLSKRMAQFR